MRARTNAELIAGIAVLLVLLAAAAGLAGASTGSRPRADPASATTLKSPTGCTPAALDSSDVLPGVNLAVSPLPGTFVASPRTQISLVGVPIGALQGVRVSGSETGSHAGHLRAYSQGDGASFVPEKLFREGETVTVSGSVAGATAKIPFRYRFTVAHEDVLPYVKANHPVRDPQEKEHFHSAPKLESAIPVIVDRSPQSAPGDLFVSPFNGPGPSGPMIFDEAGNVVWFDPLPAGVESTDLQVQHLAGRPVLTWWQGYIPPQGFGEGEGVIADASYRIIARVHAGNGFEADLHEFHISSPQDTALLSVFDPVDCNLAFLGGRRESAVTNTSYQELDLRTGLVRREWSAIDHVALADSYMAASSASREWPLDYFHLNSVDQTATGTTLISSRNTSALFELNSLTGQVARQIGGKQSSVKLGPGSATAYQHDATVLPNGTITVFDNGASPKVHTQSEFTHRSPPLLAESQGSVQSFENGNVLVGWGAQPWFSEYSVTGALLFDAHLHGSYESYRTFRGPWSGEPAYPPSIAAEPPHAKGPTTVYASWNGDTRTASWTVLAGPSRTALAAVASAPRSGFETTMALARPEAYVSVQALNSAGTVIGTSPVIPG
jgi:Arylsulfotransferase (ASST)